MFRILKSTDKFLKSHPVNKQTNRQTATKTASPPKVAQVKRCCTVPDIVSRFCAWELNVTVSVFLVFPANNMAYRNTTTGTTLHKFAVRLWVTIINEPGESSNQLKTVNQQ